MAEEKKRVPTGVIVGLGAASAAAIGLGLWLLTRRPEEPEPPTPGRANIYGSVLDAVTGEGIPNAMVTVASIVVYTDANGNYLFEDIVPSVYTIEFAAEGYEPGSVTELITEGNNEVSIALVPIGAATCEFHGGVTDSETGEAIVDAIVSISGPLSLQQFTNSWGDFSFYDLVAGEYTITIAKANYTTVSESVSLVPGRNEVEYVLVYTEPTPDIDVRWLTVEPEVISVGDTILANAQVLNLSSQERDVTIVCNVNGMTFSQVVHLMPTGEDGCWEVVMFQFTIDTPGNYVVSVGDKSQPITVAAVITGLWNPYTGEGPFDSDGLIKSIGAGPRTPGCFWVYVDGRRENVSSTWSYFNDPVCVIQLGFYRYEVHYGLVSSNPLLNCRELWRCTSNVERSYVLFHYLLRRYGEGIFAEDHIPFTGRTVPLTEITRDQYNQMKADFARRWRGREPWTVRSF